MFNIEEIKSQAFCKVLLLNFSVLIFPIYVDIQWSDLKNKLENTFIPNGSTSLDSLKVTEWSLEFEALIRSNAFLNRYNLDQIFKLMKNRLVMGSFRYGLLKSTDKKSWNRLERIAFEFDLKETTRN